MEILVLSVDHLISGFIRRGLKSHGFSVKVSFEIPKSLENYKPQLIILDLNNNADLTPLNFVKKLRDNSIHIPVLVLTNKHSERINSKIFAAGVDEQLKKPFSLIDLRDKLNELINLTPQKSAKVLKYKNIEVDIANSKVWKKKKELSLTKREYSLLIYFMSNINKIVTKEDIILNVWDYDADIRNNTIEVYVGYLRSKIEDKNETFIRTRRGFGYIFGS